jgi:hypothetical protein
VGTGCNSDDWYMVSYIFIILSLLVDLSCYLLESFFLHLSIATIIHHSNFGKLNYFLGARAAKEGRKSRYPTIDFCKTPDAICASEEHQELKWVAGYFYWINSLQSYRVGDWDYTTELHKFVENGMEGDDFISAVSGIVNRGCHNPPCGTGDVDGGPERIDNFRKVLSVFFE